MTQTILSVLIKLVNLLTTQQALTQKIVLIL